MRFAAHTTVSTDRSIGEIRSTIMRYGGQAFAQAEGQGKFAIQFQMKDRFVKFFLPIPSREDKKYLKDGRRAVRTADKRYQVWDQECRARFRALAWSVKMKLEMVETGITTFEEEFYAHILLPGGKTIYELTHENVALAYKDGKAPKALMAGLD